MTKPITPSEVASGTHIPDEVIAAFNELIAEGSGNVKQGAVVTRIMAKMPDVTRSQIFERGWLDIEGAFRKAGWKVEYDKPGYCESYEAYWTFRAARSGRPAT